MKKPIVVVLAGGSGKRFWPFTTDKSIFPLKGEPIIQYTLRKVADAGLTHFVVVTNPSNEATIRTLAFPGTKIETVIQKDAKGMGDALLTAAPLIQGSPILIVNAEDVAEDSLYSMMVSSIKKGDAFVVGRKTSQYFDGGYFQITQSKLSGIIEKPGAGNEPSQFVNLVFHYFPNADDFFPLIRQAKSDKDDVYERALDRYIKANPVSLVAYEGYWSPLKYPWHVLDATHYMLHHDLKPGRGKKVDIRNNVIIEGAVYIGNNVKIFENTKIVGPVYIGDNTIIGNSNIVRASFIGQNCVTGFNTDITRSYIGNDCWFHSNYIGDSVLERNVSMGSGSVLANFRLDEGEIHSTVSGSRRNTHRTKLGAMIGDNVRIGVNTSIMPGVKIGSHSMLGAGIVLDKDLPDDSFCVATPGYTVKKNTQKIASDNRTQYKVKI